MGSSNYRKIRPLDIIVLTDGVPSNLFIILRILLANNRLNPADDPKTVLVGAVARMKAGRHHPNAVGVQMVQIGHDADAAPALKTLMHGDVGVGHISVWVNAFEIDSRLNRAWWTQSRIAEHLHLRNWRGSSLVVFTPTFGLCSLWFELRMLWKQMGLVGEFMNRKRSWVYITNKSPFYSPNL